MLLGCLAKCRNKALQLTSPTHVVNRFVARPQDRNEKLGSCQLQAEIFTSRKHVDLGKPPKPLTSSSRQKKTWKPKQQKKKRGGGPPVRLAPVQPLTPRPGTKGGASSAEAPKVEDAWVLQIGTLRSEAFAL